MTRKQYWHLTWVSNKTNNLLSSFAKLLQLVTQALMVDFLYLEELQRKYSHFWCVFNIFIYPGLEILCDLFMLIRSVFDRIFQCNLQLRRLLPKICMTVLGHLDIFIEVQQLLPSFIVFILCYSISFFRFVYASLISQQDSLFSKTQRCNIIQLKLNLSQKNCRIFNIGIV